MVRARYDIYLPSEEWISKSFPSEVATISWFIYTTQPTLLWNSSDLLPITQRQIIPPIGQIRRTLPTLERRAIKFIFGVV
jgi:hypothetical protein